MQVAKQMWGYTRTVIHRERNVTDPAVRYIPDIIRFLGYDPSAPVSSFPERLIAGRRPCGLTQKQMANELGVDPSTLRDWENGIHMPFRKKRELIATFGR